MSNERSSIIQLVAVIIGVILTLLLSAIFWGQISNAQISIVNHEARISVIESRLQMIPEIRADIKEIQNILRNK